MNTRILSQIRNLLDIANNFKSNTNIYFFLKNYAFMVANSTLLKDNSGAFENEKKEITGMYREFRQEKANANWNYIVPKEEYVQFLEQFLSNIDFDNANLFILNVSKDLTEVLGVYGEFDDLWSRRMNYFNKRIYQMESTMNTEVKPIQQIQPQPKVNLPEPKTTPVEMNTKAVDSSNFTYTPRLVDKSIKLPISKTDPSYSKVKEIINMHIEYSGLEMDFHKLEMAKDHIEAAVYYLRNIE